MGKKLRTYLIEGTSKNNFSLYAPPLSTLLPQNFDYATRSKLKLQP